MSRGLALKSCGAESTLVPLCPPATQLSLADCERKGVTPLAEPTQLKRIERSPESPGAESSHKAQQQAFWLVLEISAQVINNMHH